jgi:hypothetical protein
MSGSEEKAVSRIKPVMAGCALAFGIAAVLFTLFAVGADQSYQARRAERARQQQKLRLREVADAKAGRANISIYDVELLEMLADDPQCIANITSVYFYMRDLGDPRYRRLTELHNVETIGFYSCDNVDNILAIAKDMESVQTLFFEATTVSDQSIHLLAEIPNLKKVRFEQIVAEETIEKLNDLLPNVQVEAPKEP